MLVRERMTPSPICITKQTTIATALQLMRENKVRRLPVMNGGKLVGIVTDRDLSEVSPSPATSLSIFELNYLLAKTSIGDILPTDQKLITVSPDEFLEAAALILRDNKIGAVPVVENEKLVGIITETNIFDAFIEIMGLRQSGYRITFNVVEDKPGILADITGTIAYHGGNITHVNAYGESGNTTIVFRIDQGDIKEIMAALKKLGYECIVNPVNNN